MNTLLSVSTICTFFYFSVFPTSSPPSLLLTNHYTKSSTTMSLEEFGRKDGLGKNFQVTSRRVLPYAYSLPIAKVEWGKRTRQGLREDYFCHNIVNYRSYWYVFRACEVFWNFCDSVSLINLAMDQNGPSTSKCGITQNKQNKIKVGCNTSNLPSYVRPHQRKM